jgi:hypothetical protein
MVLTRFVELDVAAMFVFMSALGVLIFRACGTQLHVYSCSRTEKVAAVAATMSQDFPGYFSYKLHASFRISVQAEHEVRGQSDQTRNFRVFAVAGWHPGVFDHVLHV